MNRAIVNGKLVDESFATISVVSKEARFALSVYESLMVLNSKIIYLKAHLDRLEESGKGIGLAPFNKKDIEKSLKLLVKKENLVDSTIRILLLDNGNYIITYSFLPKYSKELREEGVSTILYEGERYLPTYKTSNLLISYIARKEAEKRNCFEALLVDRNNKALEGTRSNLYAVKDNVIYTAPDSLVLSGVTRSRIIDIAKSKYDIVYKPLSIINLLEGYYDEVIISSTSIGVITVKKINGIIVSKTNKNSIYINNLLIEDRKLNGV